MWPANAMRPIRATSSVSLHAKSQATKAPRSTASSTSTALRRIGFAFRVPSLRALRGYVSHRLRFHFPFLGDDHFLWTGDKQNSGVLHESQKRKNPNSLFLAIQGKTMFPMLQGTKVILTQVCHDLK
jgi:hypothetical protein